MYISSFTTEKEVGLLFVPKQLISYFVFDYREDGTGKSLLEDLEYILSMRSTFLVSRVLAMTRAAVEKTTIDIDMTNNLDYLQTMQMLKNVFYNKNGLKLSNDPNSIVKNILDSRLQIRPKGIKGLDDYSISTSTEATQTVKPDDELLEYFDRAVITGLMIPRTAIQETETVDYAVSVASKNLFFNNVVRIDQKKLLKILTEFVRTYISYSKPIKDKIEEVIKRYYHEAEPTDIIKLDTDFVDRSEKDDSSENPDENNTDSDNEEKTEINYIKETRADFNRRNGDVISSKKTKLDSAGISILVNRIIKSIKPTLPAPVAIKNKADFQEIGEYVEVVEKIVDNIYNEDLIAIDNSEVKAQLKAIKAKIKTQLIQRYIELIGKQDTFEIPNIEDIEQEWFVETSQTLLNGFKLINDHINTLSGKTTESSY